MKTNRLLYQDSNDYQIGRRDGYDEIMSQMSDIIGKCYNTGYKDAMDFACEWIQQLMDNKDNCGYPVVASFDTTTLEEFIADFKKSMIKNLCRETSK